MNLSIDGIKAHLMEESSNTVKGWRKAMQGREKAAEAKFAAKAELKKSKHHANKAKGGTVKQPEPVKVEASTTVRTVTVVSGK